MIKNKDKEKRSYKDKKKGIDYIYKINLIYFY